MAKASKYALSVFLCAFLLIVFGLAADAQTVISPSGDKSGATDRQNITEALKKDDIALASGNYYIDKRIMIYESNRTITAVKGAVVTQITPGVGLIANDVSSGGYSSIKNITINGGTWTAQYSAPESHEDSAGEGAGFSGFYFCHADNIKILNAVLKNNFQGHLIEFAAVKNGYIENCDLGGIYGFTEIEETRNEAVQLDIAHSAEMIGPNKIYDDTACDNITIKNNRIEFPRGIGSHIAVDNHPHKNVKIISNSIKCTSNNPQQESRLNAVIRYEGMLLFNYYNTTVSGNTITGAATGIDFRTDYISDASSYKQALNAKEQRFTANEQKYNVVITGNSISNTSSYGIRLFASERRKQSGGNITNNKITNTKRAGIWSTRFSNLVLKGNTISYTGRGINGASDAESNSDSETLHSGISINNSSFSSVSGNSVSSATGSGIAVKNSPRTYVISNKISKCSNGINFYSQSDYSNAGSNSVSQCSEHGVHLSKTNSAVVYNNQINSSGKNGIYASNSPYAGIDSNNISKPASAGINVSYSPSSAVKFNNINRPGGNGIYIHFSDSSNINKNHVNSAGKNGISVFGCPYAAIRSNNISKPDEYGVVIQKSDHSSVSSNVIKNTGKHGIAASNKCDNIDLSGNKISSPKKSGISANSSACMHITGNTILSAKLYGIIINNGCRQSVISSNTVKKAKNHSIVISKSAKSTAKNNVIAKGQNGVLVQKSNKAQVNGNIITNPLKHGVGVYQNTVSVIGNTIKNARHSGIQMSSCKSSVIKNNKISGCRERGIRITLKSNRTSIIKNKISSCKDNGIFADLSAKLIVRKNNISVPENNRYGIYVYIKKPSEKAKIASNTITTKNDAAVYMFVRRKNRKYVSETVKINSINLKNKTVKGSVPGKYKVKVCAGKKTYTAKTVKNKFKAKNILNLRKKSIVKAFIKDKNKNKIVSEAKVSAFIKNNE